MHFAVLNRSVLRLKGWQIFASTVLAIAVLGYPLFLLEKSLLPLDLRFQDSLGFAVALNLCWGIWLNAVLHVGDRPLARLLSPLLLLSLIGVKFWLEDSAYDVVIVLPALALLLMVMIPAAKAVHRIEQRRSTDLLIFLDTVLVGCFFPIGVWILQLRLNAALGRVEMAASEE